MNKQKCDPCLYGQNSSEVHQERKKLVFRIIQLKCLNRIGTKSLKIDGKWLRKMNLNKSNAANFDPFLKGGCIKHPGFGIVFKGKQSHNIKIVKI